MKLSIITINYNNYNGLVKTMKSVFTQTFTEFEYIVVDGGSSDNSVELIRQYSEDLTGYSSLLKRFQWISESDEGIYNAMNKGISMANGDFLLFLNSGDELADDLVLEKVNSKINEKTDICSGILNIINQGEIIVKYPIKELSLSYCYYGGLTHPNTFIRRSLFEKFGLYNENNKIVSDWEFFLVITYFHQVIYQSISYPISNFYMDGISSIPNNPISLEETKRVIEKYIPPAVIKDIERLSFLEYKISQVNFKAMDYLMGKYAKIANIIFFPLTIIYYILKKKDKLNF